MYRQAINFNNTLASTGSPANSYVTYDVTAFNLTSNSGAMSLWLNSDLTYPITSGTNPYYINLNGTTYYALLSESANFSNISFRTGLSPGGVVGSLVGNTGVWNHHCAVFSNVGTTGASNTASYYYFNGSLVGSGNTLSQAFTALYIGCNAFLTGGALCSVDDVRLFNTALNAAQVRAIYTARGMPGVASWTGTSKSYFTNKI